MSNKNLNVFADMSADELKERIKDILYKEDEPQRVEALCLYIVHDLMSKESDFLKSWKSMTKDQRFTFLAGMSVAASAAHDIVRIGVLERDLEFMDYKQVYEFNEFLQKLDDEELLFKGRVYTKLFDDGRD